MGHFLILGPVLLRISVSALTPGSIRNWFPWNRFRPDVQQFMAPRVQSIAGLGFDPVGYVNVGK